MEQLFLLEISGKGQIIKSHLALPSHYMKDEKGLHIYISENKWSGYSSICGIRYVDDRLCYDCIVIFKQPVG